MAWRCRPGRTHPPSIGLSSAIRGCAAPPPGGSNWSPPCCAAKTAGAAGFTTSQLLPPGGGAASPRPWSCVRRPNSRGRGFAAHRLALLWRRRWILARRYASRVGPSLGPWWPVDPAGTRLGHADRQLDAKRRHFGRRFNQRSYSEWQKVSAIRGSPPSRPAAYIPYSVPESPLLHVQHKGASHSDQGPMQRSETYWAAVISSCGRSSPGRSPSTRPALHLPSGGRSRR